MASNPFTSKPYRDTRQSKINPLDTGYKVTPDTRQSKLDEAPTKSSKDDPRTYEGTVETYVPTKPKPNRSGGGNNNNGSTTTTTTPTSESKQTTTTTTSNNKKSTKPITQAEYVARRVDTARFDARNKAYAESRVTEVERKRAQKEYERMYPGTFQNEQGQGFSADPNLVLTGVSSYDIGGGYTKQKVQRGESIITYGSGRTEVQQTGLVEIYGKTVQDKPINLEPVKPSTFKSRAKEVGSKTLGIISIPGKAVNKGIDVSAEYGGIAFAEIAEKSAPITLNTPLQTKLRGYKSDVNYFQAKEFGRVTTKVGLTYLAARGSGQLIGKPLSLLPTPALKFLSSKPVTYTLLGSGVAIGGYNVATSPTPVETGLVTVSEFVGFGSGIKSGLKQSKLGVEKILKTKPKVETIEAFKTKTESFDFGKNILLDKVGVVSSQSKSVGQGLYKTNNKFFRVSFEDVGKSQNINDVTKLLRFKSNIKIQKFNYGVEGVNNKGLKYFKATTGRPSKATLDTKAIVVSSDTGFNLESASKVSSKGFTFERLSRVKGTRVNDLKTNFVGESVDISRGKILNKNVFKGRTTTDLEINQKALSGEDFIFTKSTTQNLGVNKNRISLGLKNDYKNIQKSFRKNELISGTEGVVLSSKLSSPKVNLVSNQVISNLVGKKFQQSQVREYRSAVKSVGSKLRVATPRTKTEISTSTSNSFKPKSFSVSKLISGTIYKTPTLTIPKSVSDTVIKQTPTTTKELKVSRRSSNDTVLKQSIIPTLKQTPIVKTTYLQSQKQSQVLKQKQLLTNRGLRFARPTYANIFIASPTFNLKPEQTFTSKNFGKRQSTNRYRYVRTIESQIFNIKAPKISKELERTYRTGLVNRPIITG